MAHIKQITITNDDSYLIEPTLYATATASNDGKTYTASFNTNFELVEGVCVQIKCPNMTNTAPTTFNTKNIYYNGEAIASNTLKANHTYALVYDGTQWQLVGDIDTNTDEKVKQTPTTTDASYELLFSESANNDQLTEGARKTSTLKYNPSSKTLTIDGGTLTGTNYSGKATTAGIADSANAVSLSNVSGADNLKAIEEVTGTSGLLKKTANAWSLDTSAYLTSHGPSYGKVTVSAQSSETTALTSQSSATTPTAKNANETLKFTTANKWIVATGTNSSTAGSDEIKIAHLVPSSITNSGPTSNQTGARGSTFNIPKITIDEAGHVTEITSITVSLPASNNTNTATAADNILDGSNSGTQITYKPYTAQQTDKLSFDTSNTDPTRSDRLNLNGYLYATKLYSGGTEVSVDGHTHTLSMASNTGTTNVVNLSANTTYQLTAGGNGILFKTPASSGHYNTHLYVTGANGTAKTTTALANGEVYIKLYDTSTARESYKIEGVKGIEVISDASGNLKIQHVHTDITEKTTYGSTTTTASANGGSITVTDIKYDAQGHITGSTDRTITLSQKTYSNFVKSGSGAAAGLVPKPSTTAGTTKFLCEDGTWKNLVIADLPTGTTSNDVAVGDHNHDYIGKTGFIAYPSDGYKEYSGNSVLGYIKIKIPQTKSTTMFSFDVDIYNYVESRTTRYHIAGYNYNNASWNACTAYCIAPITNTKANLTVRFLSNGNDEMYVCIGETDTSWSYPKIVIHNIVISHSNNTLAKWKSGWTITIDTTAFDDSLVKKIMTNTNIAYKTVAANLTTTTNAIAYYTDTAGTFGSKASANGALYATEANGTLSWGTLPIAQGGTGATTAQTAIKNLFTDSTVTVGIGDFTDNTIMITSNNSGSTANWYQRTGLKIWNYIKSKADSIYAGIDALNVADALVYKGVLNGANISDNNAYGALTPAANCGDTYKVSTAGFINGLRVEIGDMLICLDDDTPAATTEGDNIYTTIRNKWNIIQTSEGSVSTSVTSSTDNTIVRFDSTSGRIIKDSSVTIDDNGNISTNGNLELKKTTSGDSPALIFNRTYSSSTDWKIVVTSGKLSFQSGTNASTWAERGYFKDNSGDFVATGSISATSLFLKTAASDPSTSAGARIEFAYTNANSQSVYISYTPNNSYRKPAGLKIMGNGDTSDSNGSSPAWFEVEGATYSRNYYNLVSKTLADISLVTNTLGTANSGENNATRGTMGKAYLTIGNSVAHPAAGTAGGAGNSKGYLYIYGEDNNAVELTYNGALNVNSTITALGFTGDVTGNITGNVTGDVTGDLTGNVTGDLTGTATNATNATNDSDGNAINTTYVKKVTSTDHAIVRFDGTDGTIQNSTATINDKGTMNLKGKLIINPSYDTTTNSYNEGIRINQGSNGWSTIALGGTADSVSGTADGIWLIGRRGVAGNSGYFGAIGDLTFEEQNSIGCGLTLHKDSGGMSLYANKAKDTASFTIKNVNALEAGKTHWIINALTSAMTATSKSVILFGRGNSSKNSGYLGFYYAASGDNTNYLTLGFYAADDLVKLYPTGQLNITKNIDSESTSTGSLITAGGIGIAKTLYVGTGANITGKTVINYTTASSTDKGSSQLQVCNTNSTAGNVAIELRRKTLDSNSNGAASWQIGIESGHLHFRSDYTSTGQLTDYSHDILDIEHTTGNATFTNMIIAGKREITTAPSNATTIDRLQITPYYHTGGPWYIASKDDKDNAYLAIKYGSNEKFTLKHDGTITNATWAGTTIAVTKGGTGVTSFTNDCVIVATGTTQTLVSRGLKVTGATNADVTIAPNTDGKTLTVLGTSTLYFDSGSSSSHIFRKGSTEKIRINPSGNLQLDSGVTQSTHKLLVNGNSAFNGRLAFITTVANTLTEAAGIGYNSTDTCINFRIGSSANATTTMKLSATAFYHATNDTGTLGTSTYRWKELYLQAQSNASTNGIMFYSNTTTYARIGANNTTGGLGLYGSAHLWFRPSLTDMSKGFELSTSNLYPTTNDDLELGGTSNEWKATYSKKFVVEQHVTMQWNSTDQSLDFIFA